MYGHKEEIDISKVTPTYYNSERSVSHQSFFILYFYCVQISKLKSFDLKKSVT